MRASSASSAGAKRESAFTRRVVRLPLGAGADAERTAESNHRADHRLGFATPLDGPDEGTVDLNRVERAWLLQDRRLRHRIENRVAGIPAVERKTYELETLTRAPIDRNLVDPSLLTADEGQWLNAYHAEVYEALSPLVDDATRERLDTATQPIAA